MSRFLILVISFLLTPVSFGQALEEIVVTASIRGEPMPGAVLKIPGDFLLLEVLVTNDTRDETTREKEIFETLKNAVKLAKDESDIELSLVEDEYVIPLTSSNYQIDLQSGNRPDTSKAVIRVKTTIPKGQVDGTKIIDRLKKFVKKIPVEGRTELEALNDIDVSIVNPGKYRSQIIKLFAEDVKEVTSSLGGDYQLVAEGLDRPIQWARSGTLQLTLFIPYTYIVIPKNISAITVLPNDY